MTRYSDVKLIEETIMRFKSPAAVDFHDEKIHIDITNQLNYDFTSDALI